MGEGHGCLALPLVRKLCLRELGRRTSGWEELLVVKDESEIILPGL